MKKFLRARELVQTQSMLRKKIFYIEQNRGAPSEEVLGSWVHLHLRRTGYPITRVRGSKREVKDGIAYCVKGVSYELGLMLKERNNTIVLNLSDVIAVDRLHEITGRAFVDTVLYPNALALKNYSWVFPNAKLHRVLYHFWDDRLQPVEARGFRLGYIGTRFVPNEVMHLDEIPQIEVVDVRNGWRMAMRSFTCHYSVRRANTLAALYKPPTKLFVAAGSAANIICSRDQSVLELAPDYPYLVSTDLQSVNAGIEYARETYLGKTWNAGVEMLKSLRHKCGPEASLAAIAAVFSETADL